jgi:hypothetical protein
VKENKYNTKANIVLIVSLTTVVLSALLDYDDIYDYSHSLLQTQPWYNKWGSRSSSLFSSVDHSIHQRLLHLNRNDLMTILYKGENTDCEEGNCINMNLQQMKLVYLQFQGINKNGRSCLKLAFIWGRTSHNATQELKAQRKSAVGIQQQLHKNAVVITNTYIRAELTGCREPMKQQVSAREKESIDHVFYKIVYCSLTLGNKKKRNFAWNQCYSRYIMV